MYFFGIMLIMLRKTYKYIKVMHEYVIYLLTSIYHQDIILYVKLLQLNLSWSWSEAIN